MDWKPRDLNKVTQDTCHANHAVRHTQNPIESSLSLISGTTASYILFSELKLLPFLWSSRKLQCMPAIFFKSEFKYYLFLLMLTLKKKETKGFNYFVLNFNVML